MNDPHYYERFGGLERLYGEGCLDRLKSSHVAVVGIGGVGTWAVEALARSGIGRLTLVDLDDVCITNTNRQLHALEGQAGRLKVEAMAERVRQISPGIEIESVPDFLTLRNMAQIVTPGVDMVIDAMDSVPDKAALVKHCLEHDIPLVVSGGAGGKSDPVLVRQDDLLRTPGDALLKALRKKLKTDFDLKPDPRRGFGVPCVFSLENPVLPWEVCSAVPKPGVGGSGRIDCASGFGAVSFVTGTFGLALASYAVRSLV